MSLPAHAGEFKNEPTGFRHIAWETPFSKVQSQMVLAEKGKTSNYYTRKNDKMTIGGASLTAIYYRFYNKKFSAVMIVTKGIGNKKALIEAFEAQFGQPEKPNQFIDNYFWRGTTARVGIVCNSVSNDCHSTMESMNMISVEKADEQKTAEKAKGDF